MKHGRVFFQACWAFWVGGILFSLSGCSKEDLELYHPNPSAPLPMRVVEVVATATPMITPDPVPPAQITPTVMPSPTVAPTSTPTPAPKATRTPTPKTKVTSTPRPTIPPPHTPTPITTETPTKTSAIPPIHSGLPSPLPVSDGIIDVPVAAVTLGTPAPSAAETPAQKPTEETPFVTPYGLTIDKLQVCAQVTNRIPEGCTETFSMAKTETLFTWIKVSGVKPPKIIKHVYLWEDKPVITVTLKLQYTAMRTWSQISIKPEQIGKWKVNILTEDNKLLAAKEWTVMP